VGDWKSNYSDAQPTPPLAGWQSPLQNRAHYEISASYYEGGWSQSIFIGFLFAIAALLLGYNGYSKTEMVLSKVAAFAGLGRRRRAR